MIHTGRTLTRAWWGAWAVVAPFAPADASGEPPIRPLEIEDAVWALDFQIQGVVAAFSPDGAWVASTVCDPKRRVVTDQEGGSSLGMAADLRVGCDIWLTATAGGQPRNLTLAQGNSWGPSWSPDGTMLAFTSDRDGKPRLWIWDRSADRQRRVSDAVTRTWLGDPVLGWTADGRRLVAQLHPEGIPEEELEPKHGGPVRSADAEPGVTVVVFRSPPAPPALGKGESTGALASHLLCDIATVDLTTGGAHRLLRQVKPVASRISPDRRTLAYLDVRNPPAADSVGPSCALVALDLATGRSRDLASDVVQSFSGAMSWSPDGSSLAYTSIAPRPPATERFTSPAGDSGGGDLFVVAIDGGAPRPFNGAPAGQLDTDLLPPLWTSDGEQIFVVGDGRVWRASVATGRIGALTRETPSRVRRLIAGAGGARVWSPDGGASLVAMTRDERTKRDGFQSVDLATGALRPLLVEDGEHGYLFNGPVVSPDGSSVVWVAGSARESPDLWIAGPEFARPRRLTTLNPQLDGYTFGEGRLVDFTSADGEPLQAALLLPAGYQEGRRYPMVVWVYASDSGSRAVHRFGLVGYPAYNMQMLATRGYAVLWPDIPTHLGTPMQDLVKAVMPAIDRVVELGIADPDRLAVMGQSGGGYSTLALLVQTTRFKAAVMNAGYGDVVAMYGQMGFDGTGGWIP